MPKSKHKSVIINPNIWSFDDFNEYVKAVREQDFEYAFLILQPAIVSWDFDIDLDQDRPDEHLSFTDLPDIIDAVGTSIDKLFESLDIDDCNIDMNAWSMPDYYKYQAADREGKVDVVERYLKMVATPDYDDYDPTVRLSFPDGMLMRKAVEKAQEYLFRKRKSR